ncbi:Peptidase M20 domain-containing protein 2 [Pleurostoma richardsiae]|uniref:Peptidase M20 domain-containing protein 2 n=1 Tax=Pleurostoma richardsiae TaxID=41990 RepID=A0AA38RXW3_9PEZI|nr:Peptidase M20 domain-containing protein 2 [Pleurostoma richardsiae]
MSQPIEGDQASLVVIHQSLNRHRELLSKVNQKIFSNPETAFQEFVAHDAIVEALQSEGIKVTPHAYDVQTAFEAEYGSGGRVLTFNAEYDALPEIGHGCGHNLIATTSLGAFLSVMDALKDSGNPGRVRLLGTPAEEAHGGKITLIEKGAYKDVDACMMMHPTAQSVFREDVLGDAYDRTLAISGFKVTFHGKAAHAALAPWEGINALDAAVAGYNNISVLRQQVRPDERIHGIIVEGGSRPNVIPDKAVLEYNVRAPTLARAQALQERAVRCFRGAAEATGCELETKVLGAYADLRASVPICRAFQKAIGDLGYKVLCDTNREITPASTDQGNVSYECPSWQGLFGILSDDGAWPHTEGFARAAGKAASFERSLISCEGMAITGYRFLTDDDLALEVKEYFQKQQRHD